MIPRTSPNDGHASGPRLPTVVVQTSPVTVLLMARAPCLKETFLSTAVAQVGRLKCRVRATAYTLQAHVRRPITPTLVRAPVLRPTQRPIQIPSFGREGAPPFPIDGLRHVWLQFLVAPLAVRALWSPLAMALPVPIPADEVGAPSFRHVELAMERTVPTTTFTATTRVARSTLVLALQVTRAISAVGPFTVGVRLEVAVPSEGFLGLSTPETPSVPSASPAALGAALMATPGLPNVGQVAVLTLAIPATEATTAMRAALTPVLFPPRPFPKVLVLP